MFACKKMELFGCIFIVICEVFTKSIPGERSKQACREYGEQMLECQNIIGPKRVRVPIDKLLYPHMVLVGFGNHTKPAWKCGGTLISQDWILTAAHCMHDAELGQAKVLLVGRATFEFMEFEGLEQQRGISKIVAHPEYQPPAKYHDIALMRAEYSFTLDRDIRIACLQTQTNFQDVNATAIGFGATVSDAASGSLTLMNVEVNIVDGSKCNASLKRMIEMGYLPRGLIAGQLCAGDFEHGGRDTCQGDSGGPLQVFPKHVDCKNTFPLHTVLAVTSFGRHCGFKKAPGVYTRVSFYISWIEDVVWPDT